MNGQKTAIQKSLTGNKNLAWMYAETNSGKIKMIIIDYEKWLSKESSI